METTPLGLDAYASDDPNAADLLKNLNGCTIHGISPGTDEHAGTGLLIIELPTGEGLGLQIPMDTDERTVPFRPATLEEGTWTVSRDPTTKPHSEVNETAPDIEIFETVHHNIMDPETAEVVLILDFGTEGSFAINLHLVDGGAEFFSVDL